MKTRGEGKIIPALSFQDAYNNTEHRTQVTFQLETSVKNIGHSVAEITVRDELFLPLWKDFFDSVRAEQKRFCNSDYGKARNDYYPSAVLFPDEPYNWYSSGASLVDAGNINQIGNARIIIPVIIACVNYRLKSLPNTYQTSAVHEVFRKDNRTRFFDVGVGVPAHDIFMIRNVLLDYAY